METSRGFLGDLFDMSFTSFVSERIIRFLFVLALLASGVVALAIVIGGFGRSAGWGLLCLIVVAPLVFLILAIYARVALEIVVVIFRIADHAAAIADHTRHPGQG